MLNILLIIGSVFTFLFIMRLIRKSSVRIEDTFFWIFFSVVLILLSLFPDIAYIVANRLGFQAPINLVYVVIIFVLIVNQFAMSLKISRLTIKQKELAQQVAITNNTMNDKLKKEQNCDKQ